MTPPAQMTFDGRELVTVARPRPLTERQRELIRFVRERGVVRTRDVAQSWHALRRLEQRGLVRKVRRGHWAATITDERWA